MVDLFRSPRQKIAQAQRAIEELRAQEIAFNADEPYTRLVETDPEGLNQTHTVILTAPLPESLAELALGAADALIAALDQAVFAASKAAGGTRLMDTCFPVAGSGAALNKIIDQKCQGVPSRIMAIVRGFDTFEGGSALFWGLNKIIQAENYSLIVPLGSAESGVTFIHNETPPKVRWDAEKNALELGTFPIHGVFKPDLNVFFSAGFADAEIGQGRGVLAALEATAQEVEQCVAALETEAEAIAEVSE